MALNQNGLTLKWPSGRDKTILLLSLTPEDMQRRFNLDFIRGKDDLDWFQGSHLIDEALGPIVFLWYENSPQKGIEVNVDFDVDTPAAIDRVRKLLSILDSDIIWRSPELTNEAKS